MSKEIDQALSRALLLVHNSFCVGATTGTVCLVRDVAVGAATLPGLQLFEVIPERRFAGRRIGKSLTVACKDVPIEQMLAELQLRGNIPIVRFDATSAASTIVCCEVYHAGVDAFRELAEPMSFPIAV
jgi:hypothetical protein